MRFYLSKNLYKNYSIDSIEILWIQCQAILSTIASQEVA